MKSGEGVADRRLRDVNRRLNEVYAQAVKELEKTLKDFEQKHAARDAEMRQKLADGKITKAEYDSWKRGQVFQGKQWKAKLDAATQTLVHADEEAVRITNRERGKTFQAAANAELKNASKQTGIDFNLYDRDTVDRIMREQPNLLPPRRVKKATDSAWYHQQISNAVTRSIIEGDPIDSLARKIAQTTGESSRKAARRNARTAMTAAQNAGRMESMREVQESGIHVRKKWLATLDKRTRDSHARLDGQEQDVDMPFQSELGEIMYPGDPHADPALVYNCRCTLTYIYPRYDKASWQGGRRDQDNGTVVPDQTHSEWKAEKGKRERTDVTEEYKTNARPGVGRVSHDPGYKFGKGHKREEFIGRWLRDTFGGDVQLLQEIDESEGKQYCDYLWRGRRWELKSPRSAKASSGLLKKAVEQIAKNPGGIILDFDAAELNMDDVIARVDREVAECGFDADVIILNKGALLCIKRYKK